MILQYLFNILKLIIMRLLSVLRSRLIHPDCTGPIKRHMNNAKETVKDLYGAKQWYCGGFRSAAVAAELLRNGKVIALPTDTIYGLAGLAQDDTSIARLYEIKKREESKPLAVCLWRTEDISNWAVVENLPKGLVDELLPGPTTLILQRTSSLNPSLNPGITNVGIRVPRHDFIRSVVRMLNQPIALTSANISNEKSTLHPTEFENLWPELDGVFWEHMSPRRDLRRSWRRGSTIVDLTVEGEFNILRRGIGFLDTVRTLKRYGLKSTRDKEVRCNDEVINSSLSGEEDKENVEKEENDDVIELERKNHG